MEMAGWRGRKGAYSRWGHAPRPWIILLLLVAIALAARIYGIGRESVWYDESVSFYQLGAGTTSEFIYRVRYLNPEIDPLYFMMQYRWSQVFGTGVVSVRMLGIILGLGTVVMVYLIGKELDGEFSGVLAALLTALSVHCVYYSQEIRMYSLFTFLAMAALWSGVRFMKRGEHWALMLNILVNGLLVWTHLLSCIFLVIEGCVFLYAFRWRIRVLALWLLPQALNIALWWYVWGMDIDFARVERDSRGVLDRTFDLAYFAYSMMRLTSGSPHKIGFPRLSYVIFVFTLVLMTVMLAALTKQTWKARAIDPARAWIALIGLSLIPVFAFSRFVFPIYGPRYLPYSVIGGYLMMAFGLSVLPRIRWPIAVILVAVFAIHFATIPRPIRPDWNTASDIVNDGRPVIVLPAFEYQSLGMLDPKIVSGANASNLGQALTAHASTQAPGLWVVLSPYGKCIPDAREVLDRTLSRIGFRYEVILVGGGEHSLGLPIEIYNLHPK